MVLIELTRDRFLAQLERSLRPNYLVNKSRNTIYKYIETLPLRNYERNYTVYYLPGYTTMVAVNQS